jgi:hypothetical protein
MFNKDIKPRECRRILASGARCHSLALRGTNFCYFHQAQRSFGAENRSRQKSLLVPSLEDRAGIHLAIAGILDSIGASKIDPARARAYLYGLQLAMQNLPKTGELAARDSVTHVSCPQDSEEFIALDEDELEQLEQDDPVTQPSTEDGDRGEIDSQPPTDSGTSPHPSTEDGDRGEIDPEPTIALPTPELETPPPQKPPQSEPASDPPQELTLDISASADPEPEPPLPTTRFGPPAPWDLHEPQRTEEELLKRRRILRVVRNYVADHWASNSPGGNYRDRRRFYEAARDEFLHEYCTPKTPEPLQCSTSAQYRAILLA